MDNEVKLVKMRLSPAPILQSMIDLYQMHDTASFCELEIGETTNNGV